MRHLVFENDKEFVVRPLGHILAMFGMFFVKFQYSSIVKYLKKNTQKSIIGTRSNSNFNSVQYYSGYLPYQSSCEKCNYTASRLIEQPLETRESEDEEEGPSHILTKSIRLSINGDSFEVGLSRDDEVYLPWSWIEPYFDVYGHLDKNNDIFYFTNANR